MKLEHNILNSLEYILFVLCSISIIVTLYLFDLSDEKKMSFLHSDELTGVRVITVGARTVLLKTKYGREHELSISKEGGDNDMLQVSSNLPSRSLNYTTTINIEHNGATLYLHNFKETYFSEWISEPMDNESIVSGGTVGIFVGTCATNMNNLEVSQHTIVAMIVLLCIVFRKTQMNKVNILSTLSAICRYLFKHKIRCS